MPAINSSAPAACPTPSAPPLRLTTFTDDLLWPRLMEAVRLALRPERIGIGLFTIVLVVLIDSLVRLVFSGYLANTPPLLTVLIDPLVQGWDLFTAGCRALSVSAAATGLAQMAYGPPLGLLENYGWATLPLVILALPTLLLGYGAVARMAACDFSGGVLLPWPQAIAFALARWKSLVSAILGPLILAGLIILALAAGGYVLLHWPVLDWLGGLLYGLFLLAAALAVLILVCYALGRPLLVPAVVCEGSDGIDAIQRAYAYVLGRPVRLLVYLIFLIIQGIIVVTLAALLAIAVIALARSAAAFWTGPHADTLFPAPDGTVPSRFAARAIQFWSTIPLVLVAGFAFSYFACASTVLYLVLRRVNDAQDIGELWTPGLIEGTMAETMASRAKAARAFTATAPPSPPREGPATEIDDE
jgi:hypothetical protein